MTIDKVRLVRLLRMTESDQDAEALAAIRKSNALLRANGMNWADLIDPLPPREASPREAPPRAAPAAEPQMRMRMRATTFSTDRNYAHRMGFQRSDMIRGAIRREFPITLAFFPLWIVAELLALLFPNTYWNKNGKPVVAVFWSLCSLGVVTWLVAGAYLLSEMP